MIRADDSVMKMLITSVMIMSVMWIVVAAAAVAEVDDDDGDGDTYDGGTTGLLDE